MRVARNGTACLIMAGSLMIASTALAQEAKVGELAFKVRKIFQDQCLECHGKEDEISLLDLTSLVSSRRIVPGKPDESKLFRVISGKAQPAMPQDKDPLPADQIASIRQWIQAGAPEFPLGDSLTAVERPKLEKIKEHKVAAGNDYVLRSILADVRTLSATERRYARYFSIAHILVSGASSDELTLYRDALAKAINHLTWSTELVRPRPIETLHTVFRIDLRDLGWHKQPFSVVKDGKTVGKSSLDIYDLALLEYPLGIVYDKSPVYQTVVREFLSHAYQIRPIPYLRADWFVATATLPPLYEDFLQLPRKLDELERMLGVNSEANIANFKVARAGMITSGVSKNNRVVEWHRTQYGSYWKSYDFATSKADENMFKDPVKLNPSGGEMIFTLPNGLQGYFITDAAGNRLDEAPTKIVTDANAQDATVRNGLSCMRCHDRGMKPCPDDVRRSIENVDRAEDAGLNRDVILRLYREQSVTNKLLEIDEKRFLKTMDDLLQVEQRKEKKNLGEPITFVSKHFLEDRLSMAQATAELGLTESKRLKDIFQLPQFLKLGFAPLVVREERAVPRDSWENYFDRVVRKLRLGVPVVSLDGESEDRMDYVPDAPAPFELDFKTNKASKTFNANEDLVIFLKPTKDVYIELIFTGPAGSKDILVPCTTAVKAGTEYRYPPVGKKLKAPAAAGRGRITVIASVARFRPGVLLRGHGVVADRVVHRARFMRNVPGLQMEYSPDPFKTVKKTIVIETGK
jgi:mono/diheme cytochrome c family protein